MNIQSLTSKIIAPFLFENKDGITVLLPGGYKPPHGGHLHIANQYASDPEVREVIVLVGPTPRDGFTQQQSIEIWKMLPLSPKVKVVSTKYPSPILSAYEYIFSLPPDTVGSFALGASSKDEDQKRSMEFATNINGKYKQEGTRDGKKTPTDISAKILKAPSPIVYGRRDIESGKPISATFLRKDIADKNYKKFASNYPNVDSTIIQKIYNYVTDGLNEMYHLPVKSIKSTEGKNPIIDLALEYSKEAERYFRSNKGAEILLIFPTSEIAINVKKVGSHMGGRIELDLVSRHKASGMNPAQVIDMHDENYHEWLKKFYSQNNWVKALLSPMNERFINEGGNVFDGTKSIPKQYVDATIKAFVSKLKKVYPLLLEELTSLGSVGKKDMSGDIDMAISSKIFFDKNGEPKLKEWKISKNIYDTILALNTKRAKTAAPEQLKLRTILQIIADGISKNVKDIDVEAKGVSSGMISFKIRQYTENSQPTDDFVQADLMVGDVDWLKFSYYSDVYSGNVKGLHRTQFIVAMFAYKGYTFSHNYGVKNKSTQKIEAGSPKEAIALLNKLYGIKLDDTILSNYFELQKYLMASMNKKEYDGIIDIYLKILDSTRADVPEDLQDYWIKNKERLQLRGKFLPDTSKLKNSLNESGVAGGHRIPHAVVVDILKAYEQQVLKGYPSYISFFETGGTKLAKVDHGDLDVVVNIKGTDKAQSKKDFANYISTLPSNIIVPFQSVKYKGRKFYISGELVSILFHHNGLNVQIDNNISFSEKESKFKTSFLDLPAEKQGLISGLVKVATDEEPYQEIFKRIGINITEPLAKNERYEFTVSGQKLSLRRAILDKNSKEVSRQEVWNASDWDSVTKLLDRYDTNLSFEQLVNQAKTQLSERSKMRVKGLFKSLVSVKSGEVNTPKGDRKLQTIKIIDSM